MAQKHNKVTVFGIVRQEGMVLFVRNRGCVRFAANTFVSAVSVLKVMFLPKHICESATLQKVSHLKVMDPFSKSEWPNQSHTNTPLEKVRQLAYACYT